MRSCKIIKTMASELPNTIWKITALNIVGRPSDYAHDSLCAKPTCPEWMAGSSGALTAPRHQTRGRTEVWHLRSYRITWRPASIACTCTRAGTWRATTRTRSSSSWTSWWSGLRKSNTHSQRVSGWGLTAHITWVVLSSERKTPVAFLSWNLWAIQKFVVSYDRKTIISLCKKTNLQKHAVNFQQFRNFMCHLITKIILSFF